MFLGPPNGWGSNETNLGCFFFFYDCHLLVKLLYFISNRPGYGAIGLLAFLRKQGAAFSELVNYEHSDINTASKIQLICHTPHVCARAVEKRYVSEITK